MKKLFAVLLILTMLFSLVSCELGEIIDIINNLSELETDDSENSTDPEDLETAAGQKETEAPAKTDSNEYDPTAWIKDNFTASFYLYYSEDSDSNTLYTLKIYGDKAVMYTANGDEESRPTTIYEETADGLVQTSLMYFGDSKIAYVQSPLADKDLKSALPYVMVIAGTFGARIDSNPIRGYELARQETYIGRKCDVYEKNSGTSKSSFYIDTETGVILKSTNVVSYGGETMTTYAIYVTEFEYGNATAADVTIDLSDYSISSDTE